MDIIIVCMNQNKKIPPIVEGYYLERMFKKREKKNVPPLIVSISI